ncbi:MAG: ATP-binding protein [Elusimicrobiota bacterium]|jgi:signal transduction histidine kinase
MDPAKTRGFPGGADSVAFTLMMGIAAYLGRENPDFVYPHILWAFLALLAFNLLNFGLLARRLPPERRQAVAVGANTLLIAAILYYSGGHVSYFWVMFLLPIFSACLAFRERGILWTTGAALALLLLFHAESLRFRIWVEVLSMVVKMLTLLAAAGVTMRVAAGERRAVHRLAEEQERAERERREAREKLQHMDRLATLGTLSASIAHELKSPLASVLGFAQVGLGGPDDAPRLRRALERVEEGALRCRRTLQDMLAFARSQKSGKGACDLNALILECIELKRCDMVLSPVRIEETLAADLPAVELAGPEFQQVLFNLLGNADQALREKGGGLIRVRTSREDGRVRVVVQDDGPGIPPEAADKVWEPFYTTKPAGQGTGLGLSISRQIVEDHGGTIRLDAPPEGGARFTIEFPLPKLPAPPPPPAPARANAPSAPTRRRRVVLAEDDPGCVPLIETLLKPLSVDLAKAESFDEALRLMRAERPDLLIMDIKMPGMSPGEFLAHLDADEKLRDVPIVPVSGSVTAAALETLLKFKGLQVLEKPFDISEFDRRIREALK